MKFDPVIFEQYLRTAAAALDAAVDMLDLDALEDDDVASPGPMYLLARLHMAQGIVELELPEFQRATMATVADMIKEVE